MIITITFGIAIVSEMFSYSKGNSILIQSNSRSTTVSTKDKVHFVILLPVIIKKLTPYC